MWFLVPRSLNKFCRETRQNLNNLVKRTVLFFVIFSVLVLPSAVGMVDPLLSSAEYYFSHHDYKKALDLWREAYKRNPGSFPAILKLAQLQVLLESRDAARATLLQHLSKYSQEIELEQRNEIRTKLGSILSSFVSDEAQSAYLQATIKMQYQDWTGAMSLLTQAVNLEKDNISILKERARCELALALYEKHYLSLKSIAELYPFDLEILTDLMEAHYFHKNHKETIVLFRSTPDFLNSQRHRIVFGLALMDVGETAESVNILKSVIERQKEHPKKQMSINPIAWYALGKNQMGNSETVFEGIGNLKQFLILANQSGEIHNKKWDSLRLTEKVADAQQLLEKHKSTSPDPY